MTERTETGAAQRRRRWRWRLAGLALITASLVSFGLSVTTFRHRVQLEWQNLENQIAAVDRDSTSLRDQKRLLHEAFQDLTTYRELQVWSAVLATLLGYAGVAVLVVGNRVGTRPVAGRPSGATKSPAP